MAKRAMVQPRWLDGLLLKWGRTLPGCRGWYTVSPMLQSGIPASKPDYEPWDLQPKDFDDLVVALARLEDHDKRWFQAIRRAYKPHCARDAEEQLAPYCVSDRSWRNWVHEGAAWLEREMSKARLTV